MTEPLPGAEAVQSPVVSGDLAAQLAQRAEGYRELTSSLLLYVLKAKSKMVHISNLDWLLAGELKPAVELGAVEGDVGLELTVAGHFDPLTMAHDYELTLRHMRSDDVDPVEDEVAYFPGSPTAEYLLDFDTDTGRSWCAVVFAAVSRGKFKKSEARARWSLIDPGTKSANASRSYAAAQAAFAAWMERQTQAGQGPAVTGEQAA